MTRYYLRLDVPHAPEVEVSREEWVRAERQAGFYPSGGDPLDEPCTACFSARGVQGRVEYAREKPFNA